MVMGHIGFGSYFDHYIHAFHMPLFFFVTGLFFKRKNNSRFSVYIRKITKQLLVPYFIWAMICYTYAFFTGEGIIGGKRIAFLRIFTFNNDSFPIAGALWYLTCLFFCLLILYFIDKYSKSEIVFGSFCILFFLIGFYYNYIIKISLWWSLSVSFTAVGLVYFGYLTNKYQLIKRLTSSNIFITFLLFLINLICIMKTGYVNMRVGSYPNMFLFLFNFFLSQIVYFNISKILATKKILKPLVKHLAYIGQYSIVFLCLNQFVILICAKLFYRFQKYFAYVSLYNIFLFFIVTVILYFIAKMTMKTKLKILFGK